MIIQDKADRLLKLRAQYPELEIYYEVGAYLTTLALTNYNVEEQFKKIEEVLKKYKLVER
jgi:hypothetical protein